MKDSENHPTLSHYDRLVCKCFQLREHCNARRDLDEIFPGSTFTTKLFNGICFLGRLRAAYQTFLKLAMASSAFVNVKIHAIPVPDALENRSKGLSLAQAFELSGLTFSKDSFQKHISGNKKRSIASTEKDLKHIQNDNARVHAEVQLVHYMERNAIRGALPYIGASKRSCYLCAAFLRCYKDFKTRGSHGHLYSRWTVPVDIRASVVESSNVVESSKIANAIKEASEALRRLLCRPIVCAPRGLKESSIGLTKASVSADVRSPEWQESKKRYDVEWKRRDNLEAVRKMWLQIRPKSHPNMPQSEFGPSSTFCACNAFEESDHQPAKSIEEQCGACPRMSNRKCSRCNQDIFCSEACETKASTIHRLRCSPGRPLNTADYLVLDILKDKIPDAPEVRADFWFDRLLNLQDQSKLLGLYQGLHYCGVTPEELHEWQREGMLKEHIIEVNEQLSAESRGRYYPWFLDQGTALIEQGGQKTLSDIQKYSEELARPYLELEDQRKGISELKPPAKLQSFILLMMLRIGGHPPPELSDLHEDFGFCLCNDEFSEAQLASIYETLLVGDHSVIYWAGASNAYPPNRGRATFGEFWRAFEENTLTDLMDAKGLKSERQQLQRLGSYSRVPTGLKPERQQWQCLESYLKDPACRAMSVWPLKRLLKCENEMDMITPVYVDYGFTNCSGYKETVELRKVYTDLLELADPLALHEACVEGNLFAFATIYVPLEPRFEELMMNPYPLPRTPD